MSSNCHYGCFLGRRCLGSDRAEVIEYLADHGEAGLESKSDDELDDLVVALNDGQDGQPEHIKRSA